MKVVRIAECPLGTKIKVKVACAFSAHSDQSLSFGSGELWTPGCPESANQRLLSDCANAQATCQLVPFAGHSLKLYGKDNTVKPVLSGHSKR